MVAAFLRGGAFDRHLREMRVACQRQIERMREAIGRYFPPGTRVTKPAGGFLLWVEMPAEVDSLRLFDEALAEGISITPGSVFSARLRFRNCIRLNCGRPWSETIEKAVATLGRLAARTGSTDGLSGERAQAAGGRPLVPAPAFAACTPSAPAHSPGASGTADRCSRRQLRRLRPRDARERRPQLRRPASASSSRCRGSP